MATRTGELKETFDRMISGFRATDIICAGVELGIYEKLAKNELTAKKLASQIKGNLRGTRILLDASAALGLLNKKDDVYSLSPMSRECLVPDSPNYAGSMVKHIAGLRLPWMCLKESVKTGRPIPKPELPEAERKLKHRAFITAMEDASRDIADSFAASLDLTNVKSVLDVGGGPGLFLFAMIRRQPGLTGAVLDLPETIEITREMINKYSLKHAVGTIQADMLNDDFGDGFDLVLLSSIIHIFSPSVNKKIIKKCASALNPGGQLIIKDFFLDPSGTSPVHAAIFSVNMLVNTPEGSSYTESEVRSWMESAGLEKIKLNDSNPGFSYLAGRKPKSKK